MCSRCGTWKTEAEYNAWNLRYGRKRFCKDYVGKERRRCVKCGRDLVQQVLGKRWNEDESARMCLQCSNEERHKCNGCGELFAKCAFSNNQWGNARDKRRCRECTKKANNKSEEKTRLGDMHAANASNHCQREASQIHSSTVEGQSVNAESARRQPQRQPRR